MKRTCVGSQPACFDRQCTLLFANRRRRDQSWDARWTFSELFVNLRRHSNVAAHCLSEGFQQQNCSGL